MKVNNELNALSTLANAVGLGVAVIHEVFSDELGSQIVTDQGRDGIGLGCSKESTLTQRLTNASPRGLRLTGSGII